MISGIKGILGLCKGHDANVIRKITVDHPHVVLCDVFFDFSDSDGDHIAERGDAFVCPARFGIVTKYRHYLFSIS